MTIAKYLIKTKSAGLHLFYARDEYLEILRNSLPPVYTCFGQPTVENLKEWESQNRAEIDQSLKLQREFVAEYFAMAVICGSILQIAHQGIEMLNRVGPLPECLAGTATETNRKARIFCVGRSIRSIPLGLLVYAGRNQHMHVVGSRLWPGNRVILEKFDLVDVNESGDFHSVAPAVLEILGWNNYDSYERDMNEL